MSNSKRLPIDPKDLFPAGMGFVLGIGILVFFFLLAKGIGLTTLVDYHNVPHQ